MTQPRYPKEPARWRDFIEKMLQQHHVDIQRLWRRIPQTPFASQGVPLTGDTTVEIDQGSGTTVGTVISGPPNEFGSPNSYGPYSGSPFSGTPQTGGTVNTGGTATGTPSTGGTASGTVETGGTATGTPAGGLTGGTNTVGTNTGGTTTAGTTNTGGTPLTGGSASAAPPATGTMTSFAQIARPRSDFDIGGWQKSGPYASLSNHLRATDGGGASIEPDDSNSYIYCDSYLTPKIRFRSALDALSDVPDHVPVRLVFRARCDQIVDVEAVSGTTHTGAGSNLTSGTHSIADGLPFIKVTLQNMTHEGSGTRLTGSETTIVAVEINPTSDWKTYYYYLTTDDRSKIAAWDGIGLQIDGYKTDPIVDPLFAGFRHYVTWVELQALYSNALTGGTPGTDGTTNTGGTTTGGTPNTGGTASGTIETGGTPQTGGTTTAGTTNTGGTNTGGTILTGGTPNTGTGSPGFPVIRSTSQGNSGANQTSHAITMPAGFAAGDILLVAFGNDGTATTSITSGTGWNTIFSTASTVNRLTVYWKRADGSGDNLTIGTSASEGSAYAAYAIYGAHASTNVEGTGAAAVVVNPNPPSLNPTGWGTENTLWFAGWSWDNSTISTTAFPANYTQSQINERWNNSNGVGVAMAARMLNAASEDPGTGTISALASLVTMTIAVRPN